MVKQAEKKLELKKIEKELQRKWEEERILERIDKAREGKELFYFLDGPPYASGAIHLGTGWNKIIKDAALRYLTLRGYNVRKQPGWDCHGLPIEVKVETQLGITTKKEIEEKIGVENFVKACKSWAEKHIKIMTSQFKRLGVLMHWDKPYKTLNDAYMDAAWRTVKKAHEKGLLTKSLRVITFCPRCETALAEHEINYDELEDPSIYVKFPLKDRENEFLLIWTTTPWTLIGNLAVMVNESYDYVKAMTKEGMLIIAKELAYILKEKLGLDYEIIEEFKGSKLEGLRYIPPLDGLLSLNLKNKNNAYYVILSDSVTLEEGTGLVHSAPGHGPEDFEACSRYGIEALCPVDESGRFTKEAGVFAGLVAKKDDRKIIEELKKRGLLLKEERIKHRYGFCWRCATPILYRAASQWFIKVTELKEKMLEEIERATWIPSWAGSARFRDWIRNAKDWCISRQRYWGIPMPIWVCKNCGNVIVIGSKKELEERSGKKVKELHRPYVDEIYLTCEKCGGKANRVSEVLDVWFDSGVAPWASLKGDKKEGEIKKSKNYRADLIIEGHDQTRGWFYSLLICGLLTINEIPYKKVVMHGFTLDESGEKMSKSRGNIITPEEVIEKYGADILRFYVLYANKPWEDLKFSYKELQSVARMFNILWNSVVFASMYMALDNFSFEKNKDAGKYYALEDKFIISKLNSLIKEVEKAFNDFEFYRATRAIYNFITEDLSRFYIPLIRPKTWIESETGEKLASYHALYRVFRALSIAISPIAPHIAEKIYLTFDGEKESISLENWQSYDESEISVELENAINNARKIIEEGLSLREDANIKRRWPIAKAIFIAKNKSDAKMVKEAKKIIKNMLNAKEVLILNEKEAGSENFKTMLEKIKKAERDFELGKIIFDLSESDELKAERLAREIVRRVQSMRKELNLEVEDFIFVNVQSKNKNIEKYIKMEEVYIKRETRAREININKENYKFKKAWKIGEEEILISIEKR